MEVVKMIFGFIGRAFAAIFRWIGDSADEEWFWYAVVAGIAAFVIFRLWQNSTVRMVVVFVTGIFIALLVTGAWRP